MSHSHSNVTKTRTSSLEHRYASNDATAELKCEQGLVPAQTDFTCEEMLCGDDDVGCGDHSICRDEHERWNNTNASWDNAHHGYFCSCEPGWHGLETHNEPATCEPDPCPIVPTIENARIKQLIIMQYAVCGA